MVKSAVRDRAHRGSSAALGISLYNCNGTLPNYLASEVNMSRIRVFSMPVRAAFLVFPAKAQAPNPKDLVGTHAFDLACCRLGEAELSDMTMKSGVQASNHLNNHLGGHL